MSGKPLATVKEAAIDLVQALQPSDRLAVVAFDHEAKVIVPSAAVRETEPIIQAIQALKAQG